MIVVVGGSVAGVTAAQTLRHDGYDGPITIVGEENHLAYDRPPLSKHLLSGEWEPDRLFLPVVEGVTWKIGTSAIGLNIAKREVQLSSGERLAYQDLVIATGVRPRQLPFAQGASGVHVLRTMDDALALRDDLRAGGRLVVIGAGVLGCEVAAVAATMGLDVTVVDPLSAPMETNFGPWLGGLIAELHDAHGVRVRTGVQALGLIEVGGSVTGVKLGDGTVLPASTVFVAVGCIPATSWLAGSSLSLTNGVDCDSLCRAAPHVVAAGDVASWVHPVLGERLRVEHRMNASDQAIVAARTLMSTSEPYAPIPFFWTDQYDVKMQAHGTFPRGAETIVVVGEPHISGRFVVAYTVNGRIVGVVGWNRPRETRELRAHIGQPLQELFTLQERVQL